MGFYIVLHIFYLLSSLPLNRLKLQNIIEIGMPISITFWIYLVKLELTFYINSDLSTGLLTNSIIGSANIISSVFASHTLKFQWQALLGYFSIGQETSLQKISIIWMSALWLNLLGILFVSFKGVTDEHLMKKLIAWFKKLKMSYFWNLSFFNYFQATYIKVTLTSTRL